MLFSAVLTLACGITASYAKAINNHAVTAQLEAVSKLYTGNYYLQSAGTGQWLSYKRSPQSIFPKKGKKYAAKLQLKKTYKNYVMIHPLASNAKALSAQWDRKACSDGCDWAATMYMIGLNPKGEVQGPTNHKQDWLLVPANKVNKVGKREFDESTNATVPIIDHEDAESLFDEDDYEQEEQDDDDEEDQYDILDKRGNSDVGKKIGSFYVITRDHIVDMKTEALQSCSFITAGNYRSTCLRIWKKGQRNQIWNLYKANN